MSIDAVHYAIEYANAPHHGGQGYEIRVGMVGGTVITGTVDAPSIKALTYGVLELQELDRYSGTRKPVWVTLKWVTHVEVVW